MQSKIFKMRQRRKSLNKLMTDSIERDKQKLKDGTHEYVYDAKLRCKTLIKKVETSEKV